MLRILCFSLTILMISVSVYADKIFLTNGKVIEGQIVNEDKVSTTIMTGNRPQKFYTAQIDHIEKDKTEVGDSTIDYDAIELLPLDKIPQQKRDLVNQFLIANGTRENLEKEMSKIIKTAPDERKSELQELLNVDEIINRIIPVYDKYYTEFELIELIRFYESPVATKIFEVTPKILQESLQVSVQYFMEKVNK